MNPKKTTDKSAIIFKVLKIPKWIKPKDNIPIRPIKYNKNNASCA